MPKDNKTKKQLKKPVVKMSACYELRTRDKISISNLVFSSKLYEVETDEKGYYIVKDIIVQNLVGRVGITQDEMKTIFFGKSDAEQLAFKNNKLKFEHTFPKVNDYKGNYKKALRILADFTDEQVFEFVKFNFKNNGTI